MHNTTDNAARGEVSLHLNAFACPSPIEERKWGWIWRVSPGRVPPSKATLTCVSIPAWCRHTKVFADMESTRATRHSAGVLRFLPGEYPPMSVAPLTRQGLPPVLANLVRFYCIKNFSIRITATSSEYFLRWLLFFCCIQLHICDQNYILYILQLCNLW